MDPITYITLATELKDLMLRSLAKGMDHYLIDLVILNWINTKVYEGNHLADVIRVYDSVIQSITKLLEEP